MSNHTNIPLKTIYIEGKIHTEESGSIIIKPNSYLKVLPSERLAFLYYGDPKIVSYSVTLTISTTNNTPLKNIFDLNNTTYPSNFLKNGEFILEHGQFQILKLKDGITDNMTLNVSWTKPEPDIETTYPPEMEIIVDTQK